MKLLTKTSIYYLFYSIPILLIAGIISFILISSEINDSIDEDLLIDKIKAEKILSENDTLLPKYLDFEFHKTFSNLKNQDIFSDTTIYDTYEKELDPFRSLTSICKIRNQNYEIVILKKTLETEDLYYGVISSLTLVFIALLIGFIFINWWISKQLWKPFNKTLNKLENYKISNSRNLLFKKENIQEFNLLNIALNTMTNSVYNDYVQQKEFTENASHEIQTPLAVIQSKIDLLIQSKQLGNDEMIIIDSIQQSVKRLSQLNKTLLLLVKIENNQFNDSKPIILNNVIEKSLLALSDFANNKNINISKTISEEVTINIDNSLCEILINNLFQNAIRHNIENGTIEIILEAQSLTIKNSGPKLNFPIENLFNRFNKDQQNNNSFGLGLSIVKSIVELYKFKIEYHFINDIHEFKLTFKK